MPSIDIRNIRGQVAAAQLHRNMVLALPFNQRHKWLVGRGWQDKGVIVTSNGRLKHKYHREDLIEQIGFYPINQTAAVEVECWNIMQQKGIVR